MSVIFYMLSLVKRKPPIRTSKYNLPLPRVCHLELGADVIGDRKIFIIGDVHGCYDELSELCDLARQKVNNPLFIFVGDLTNKGPKSKEVLELVQSMDCYSVRGNHDEEMVHQYFLKMADPTYAYPDWCSWLNNVPSTDIEYLKDLPFTISIPSLNATIVHAGLVPGLPFEGQDLRSMTHMRNIEEKITFFHGANATLVPVEKTNVGVPWASLWPGPDHVYFGHDAVRGLQKHPFATGLDTGCVYGKQLSGIILDSKEMLSVKSRQPTKF